MARVAVAARVAELANERAMARASARASARVRRVCGASGTISGAMGSVRKARSVAGAMAEAEACGVHAARSEALHERRCE